MTDMQANNSGEETGPLTVDQAVQRLREPKQDSEAEAEDGTAAPEEEAESAPIDTEDSEREEAEADSDEEAEAAPEETEEAEDSGEESDDEEAEQESDQDDPVFEVQGQKVPVSELKNGYLRQSDYTRKTQALKQQEQELHQQYSQVRNALEQELSHLASATPQEQEPDWNKLYQEDPTEYAIQRERFRQKQDERQQLVERQRQLQQQREAEQQHQVKSKLTEEFQQLQEKVPEWQDREKAKKEIADIKSWVKSRYGFSDDDFNGLHDHRAIMILRDAMKADKLDKRADVAKHKVKDKPKVMKPGSKTRQVSANAQKRKNLRNQVRKTGKIDDAAAYLLRK